MFVTNHCWTLSSQQKRHTGVQNSVHTTKLNGTHILQMLWMLAFVFTLLQIQICCSKAYRTTNHTARCRTWPPRRSDFIVCQVPVFWQSQLFFGTRKSSIAYSKFKGSASSSQILTSSEINPASKQVIPKQKTRGYFFLRIMQLEQEYSLISLQQAEILTQMHLTSMMDTRLQFTIGGKPQP